MHIINRLQKKLGALCPECKWGVDSANPDTDINPNDDYDRIVEWTGPDPKPDFLTVDAVTDQDIDDAGKDKEADKKMKKNETDAMLELISDLTGTDLNTVKQKYKTFLKSKL